MLDAILTEDEQSRAAAAECQPKFVFAHEVVHDEQRRSSLATGGGQKSLEPLRTAISSKPGIPSMCSRGQSNGSRLRWKASPPYVRCHGLAGDDSAVPETKICSVRKKLTWQAFPECLVMGCCIGMEYSELSQPLIPLQLPATSRKQIRGL
jgi:hypothetical protein